MSTELNANLNISTNVISQSEGTKTNSNKNLPEILQQPKTQANTENSTAGKAEKSVQSGKELPHQSAMQGTTSENEHNNSDHKGVLSAVEELNNYVQTIGRQLKFNVDDDTGRLVVSVLDSETKELIRQIPSEEVMTIARNLQATGDDKVNLFDAQV